MSAWRARPADTGLVHTPGGAGFGARATLCALELATSAGGFVGVEDVAVDIDVDDPGPPLVPGARRPENARSGKRTILRLSWRRSDPLAVELQLTSTPDHPALPRGRWVVLRDFLRYGLEEPTGDGEVRIVPDNSGEPDCHSCGEKGTVSIRLARDGRPAWVKVPCSTVRAFLDETEAIVASGEESSEEALDALIRALLKA
jgi:hypothetical protein